ncbi:MULTISPECIES: hypothetical protein [Kitasatospora]
MPAPATSIAADTGLSPTTDHHQAGEQPPAGLPVSSVAGPGAV